MIARSLMLAALLIVCLASPARAERPGPDQEVGVEIGIDGAPLRWGADYQLRFPRLLAGGDLRVGLGSYIPAPGFNFDDGRHSVWVRWQMLALPHLVAELGTGFTWRHQKREGVRAHAFSIPLRVSFGPRWRVISFALESETEFVFGAALRHTERYRKFYPGVKDGFYAATAFRFQTGLVLNIHLGRFTISPRGGIVSTPGTSLLRRNDWVISYLPYYVVLRGSVRF